MRPLARPTAALAILALAACEKPASEAASPQAARPEVAYACADGQTLKATYTDARTAVVSYRGQTFTLTLEPSASGSRYAGAGREWWIKAYPDREEGTLSPSSTGAAAGGPPIAVCRKAPTPGTGMAPVPTPAALTACRSGDLTLTRLSEDAGAGQRHIVYAFTNNAAAACTLKGYATASWFDADGAALAGVTVTQSDAQMASSSGPPSEVALAPKGRAVFHVSYTGIQATDKPCVASKRLRATPPGNTQAIEIDDVVTPCTDRITLGPVRADPGDANL